MEKYFIDFKLSSNEIITSKKIVERLSKKITNIKELEFDSFSSYWFEMLTVLENFVRGKGEVIAILDSGYSFDLIGNNIHIDKIKSIDLTGEGQNDCIFHGTAISQLISLVAPEAQQYHVKIFNRRGTIPGITYDEKLQIIKNGLEHVENIGADVVNVSWNILNRDQHFKPYYVCQCQLCSLFNKFVKTTGIHVFVSEGNFNFGKNNSIEQWVCPASCGSITPVFSYKDGRPKYVTNNIFQKQIGIPAPSEIILPKPHENLKLSGSSFSTPLVAATFTSLNSTFKENGYDGLSIPKNPENDNENFTYNFYLDNLFVPPDKEFYYITKDNIKNTWIYNSVSIGNSAKKLYQNGDYAKCGMLYCINASLMFVAFKRMDEKRDYIGQCISADIIAGFINGISSLLSSNQSYKAGFFLKKACEYISFCQAKNYGLYNEYIEKIDNLYRQYELYYIIDD